MKIALLCVGNKLMLDDGVAIAAYEELISYYDFSNELDIYDLGCMSFDMLSYVDTYDVLISLDALEATHALPGTIFRFKPEDMKRHSQAMHSLHDMKLTDLFEAATLMGYTAQGVCLGMQVENPSPSHLSVGLTPKVHEALPKFIDSVLAELTRWGIEVRVKKDGRIVDASWQHCMTHH